MVLMVMMVTKMIQNPDDSNVENAVEIQELSFVTHLFFHWQADRCIVHGMFRRMTEMMMVMIMVMMMVMMHGC